jgi:hypothetical protein
MRTKSSKPDRRFCSRCGKPVNLELYVRTARTAHDYDHMNKDGGYGRFSLLVDCPWCGLRQKKIVKFGNKSFLEVTALILRSWELFKNIEPETDKKFKTFCWVKDIDL